MLRDPPFQVMVTELADSAVTIGLRCWANSADFGNLRVDLLRNTKERLDAAGISIPFPQRDVHLVGETAKAPAQPAQPLPPSNLTAEDAEDAEKGAES